MSTESQDPGTQIGEVEIAGATHPIRVGLGMTVFGITDPALGYALQKAWYDKMGIPEPDRVKERRLRAGEPSKGDVRVAGASGAGSGFKSRSPARSVGPSAASLIRKGLSESQTPAEIMATVQAFGRRCTMRDIAYYKAKETA